MTRASSLLQARTRPRTLRSPSARHSLVLSHLHSSITLAHIRLQLSDSDRHARRTPVCGPVQGVRDDAVPEVSEARYVLSRSDSLQVLTCCSRHYSYECTVAPTERPYNPRPSRSQQLANPKLRPKLSNSGPLELLRKEGVADEALARRAAERRRQRSPFSSRSPARASVRQRSRSASLSSSGSVSTISTNRSRSPRPMQDIAYPSQKESQRLDDNPGRIRAPPARKRRRSSSSSSASSRSRSVSSASSYRRRRSDQPTSRAPERITRRRRKSVSPDGRGRERGDSRDPYRRRRKRSRSWSRDRGNIARHRQSMTPDMENRVRGHRQPSPLPRVAGGGAPQARDGREHDPGARWAPVHAGERKDRGRQDISKPRVRSLSPFSKRLALTQAMSRGA